MGGSGAEPRLGVFASRLKYLQKGGIVILITGGGGLIGLNLARYLVDREKEVLLLQRHPTEVPSFLAPFWGDQIKEAIGNILDLPLLLGFVKTYQIESIIHAAGTWEGRGGEGTLHQVVQVATKGTINVLEAAHLFGLRRVTFISSVAVYTGWTGAYLEDSYLPPVSFSYIGNTKKVAEQICLLYANEYGLSVPSIRVGRVYGPTAHWQRNPLEVMVTDAIAGKSTDLSNISGRVHQYPIYVKDCARGISLVHLAKSLKHYHYNLSEGKLYTWFEIAQVIKELIPDAEIRLGTTEPEEATQPQLFSIGRIRKELGFVPDYDLKRGIKAYADWFREGKY